ncbi:uncharacterized protein [Oscarella lobularis]|uniref:uncharacterized protein isoform X3 n=1 Tax=Oscarella lobularis TaxID=121494 RepID=UPI0033133623
MKTFMASVRERYAVGLVGVSDQSKILEQMGGKDAIHSYDYVFAENGLVAYKNGELVAVESIKTFMGEEKLKQLINFCLHYIADLDIPIKRGTFIVTACSTCHLLEEIAPRRSESPSSNMIRRRELERSLSLHSSGNSRALISSSQSVAKLALTSFPSAGTRHTVCDTLLMMALMSFASSATRRLRAETITRSTWTRELSDTP